MSLVLSELHYIATKTVTWQFTEMLENISSFEARIKRSPNAFHSL